MEQKGGSKEKGGKSETDRMGWRGGTERNSDQVPDPGTQRPVRQATCRGQLSPQLSAGENSGVSTAVPGAFFPKHYFPSLFLLEVGREVSGAKASWSLQAMTESVPSGWRV